MSKPCSHVIRNKLQTRFVISAVPSELLVGSRPVGYCRTQGTGASQLRSYDEGVGITATLVANRLSKMINRASNGI